MKINVQSIKFDADQKLLDLKSASWKSFLTTSSAVMSLSRFSLTMARQ